MVNATDLIACTCTKFQDTAQSMFWDQKNGPRYFTVPGLEPTMMVVTEQLTFTNTRITYNMLYMLYAFIVTTLLDL